MGFEEGKMEHRGVKVLLCLAAVLVLGFSAWADSIVVGTATGTGFIVSSDGYILTNEHVVEKATEVKVTIGTREYTATVVATLPGSDLALLKVDARSLPAVHLGNSDQMDIGDEVYALGCPGGVCGTATIGRIANVGVTIRTDGERVLQSMLMVDITTDHGSSGGPLVNTRGEVVGITTAGRQGAFGFSIPINQAIPLLQRIPGFSTAQMGQRTQELTFRDIRALVGPSTTFVVAPVTLALTSLLPTAIPRYETEARGFAIAGPSGGTYAPTVSNLALLQFLYPERHHEDTSVAVFWGFGAERSVKITLRLFDDATAATQYAKTTTETALGSQWSAPAPEDLKGDPFYKEREWYSVRRAITIGDTKLDFVLTLTDSVWTDFLDGRIWPSNKRSCPAAREAIAALPIGRIVLSLSLLEDTFLSRLREGGRTETTSSSLRAPDRPTYTYVEVSSYAPCLQSELSAFTAEVERVFRIAVQALLDGLPKG